MFEATGKRLFSRINYRFSNGNNDLSHFSQRNVSEFRQGSLQLIAKERARWWAFSGSGDHINAHNHSPKDDLTFVLFNWFFLLSYFFLYNFKHHRQCFLTYVYQFLRIVIICGQVYYMLDSNGHLLNFSGCGNLYALLICFFFLLIALLQSSY